MITRFEIIRLFFFKKIGSRCVLWRKTTKEDIREHIERIYAAIDQDITLSLGEHFRQCLAMDNHHIMNCFR